MSNVYPHPHFSEHYIVKMVDAGVVKSVFKAFDPEETGTIDLFFLREIIYAYGINTTNDICLSLGQVKKEGKSFAEFNEVLEMVNAASESYLFSDFIIKERKYFRKDATTWGSSKTAKERADQAWNESGAAREHDTHRLEKREMDN